jgi:multidrug transporter EmrE-like cation transporter
MLTEIFILLSLVFLESIAEYELKKASVLKSHYSYLLMGIFFYGLVALFFYFYLFHVKNLAIANAVWNGGNMILITLVSVMFFHEHLQPIQYLGLVMIGIGIILARS